MNRFVFSSLILTAAAGVAQADTFFNFAASNGGFTTGGTAGTGNWVYGLVPAAPGGGNAWSTPGSLTVATNSLTSPAMTVDAAGTVTGSFTHRYNFENTFDGGQIQYSTNGGANWNTITQDLITGSSYSAAISNAFGSPIPSQRAYSGTSAGNSTPVYVTASFTIGTGAAPYLTGAATNFAGGESLMFRFTGNWDQTLRNADPNWQIGELRISNASVPAPGAAALLGLGGLIVGRRRR